MQPTDTLEWYSLCPLRHKLVAQATDEVYATTRERVVECDKALKSHRYVLCIQGFEDSLV